jgi:pyruvate/2-oxoglutarate dehydrogenase complex dihydrolipoamide dehydrogenase (E3) component
LAREGITARSDAKYLRIDKQGDDIVMIIDCSGTWELRGSQLLIATGQRPNTDDLGLDRTILFRGRVRLQDRSPVDIRNGLKWERQHD